MRGMGMCVIAFAAAVAGVRRAHEARGELVGQVALEDAVLDEDVSCVGDAFVVDVERAAAVGHACRCRRRCTFEAATCWPISPAKAEVFLRLKSASRPWPTASCSRTPGQPGPRTTSISPAGAGDGAELQDRLRAASRGEAAPELFRSAKWSSSRRGRRLPRSRARVLRAVLGDDEDIEAGERLGVAGEGAVGPGDEDAAQLVGVAGANLHDARIGCAGRAISTQQQVKFACDVRVALRGKHRIEVLLGTLAKSGDRFLCRAAGNECRSARGTEETTRMLPCRLATSSTR